MKSKFILKRIHGFLLTLILVYFVSPIFFSRVRAGSIVIVQNHNPNAHIVLPALASVQIQNSAKILQQYLQKSTGAIVPISFENNDYENISIHIGVTQFVKTHHVKYENLDAEGFILEEIDLHNYIIVGGSDWGTEYGVYSFLERFLHVAWLMPGDVGTDIPKFATIVLPAGKIVDSPVFLSRQLSPIDITSKEDLDAWGRFNRVKGRVLFHHNLLHLLDPNEYFKTNPDFYPEVGGKINMPKDIRWQPNFSAAGIVDSASKKIIYYFEQHPKATSYSLGINDFSTFDQSPSSLKRRNGKKNFLGFEDVSNDYFKWANMVAKNVSVVYPTKLFGLLAYNNVATPPSSEIGVDPHLIPFLTYERLKWADTERQDSGHQLSLSWSKLCTSIGWYDYDYGLDYLLPRVWFHEMRKYLIWGSEHNVKYYYAELYPNWGEGPKSWVLTKLLWNPYLNVDSLLNVWYTRFGGEKAAVKLKQFYSLWENFWTKVIPKTPWFKKNGQYLPYYDRSYLNYVPSDYITQCDSLMNSAYSLADNSTHAERILKLKQMWQVYKTGIEVYGLNRSNLPVANLASQLNNLASDSLFSQSVRRIKLEFQIK